MKISMTMTIMQCCPLELDGVLRLPIVLIGLPIIPIIHDTDDDSDRSDDDRGFVHLFN